MKIIWSNDLHLNFLDKGRREIFYKAVDRENADCFLVAGDIGVSSNVCDFLQEMEYFLRCRIFFVLGNHDYYYGSFEDVHKEISNLTARSQKLCWLDKSEPVEVGYKTALIGVGGWADGRTKNISDFKLILNDYIIIEDFKKIISEYIPEEILSKPNNFGYAYFHLENKTRQNLHKKIIDKLNGLGDFYSAAIEKKLVEALKKYDKIIFVTHIPSFKESTWHEGKISDDMGLPHFSCKSMGKVLKKIFRNRPDKSISVLCGHTHSFSYYKVPNINIEVFTGEAKYGSPEYKILKQ